MNSNTLKLVGAFSIGSAVTAVVGYFLHRKLTAELLDELESTRYELKVAIWEKREIEKKHEVNIPYELLARPAEVITKHESVRTDKNQSEDLEEDSEPEDEEEELYLESEQLDSDSHEESMSDDTTPYRIDYATYLYSNLEWSKLEIDYYVGDDTLVDSDGEILMDGWCETILEIEEPLCEYWDKNGKLPELWWRVPSMEMDVDVLFNEGTYFGEDHE